MDVAQVTRAGLGPSAHVDTFCRDSLPPPEQWPDLLFRPARAAATRDRLNCAEALLAGPTPTAAVLLWPGGSLDVRASCASGSTRIAHVLVEDLGLVPGNRVLLRGPNSPWLVACWLGRAEGRRRRGGDDARAAPGRAALDRRDHPAGARPVRRPVHRRPRRRRCPDLRTVRLRRRRRRRPGARADRHRDAVPAGRHRGRRRRAARGHLGHHRRAEDDRALPPGRARDRRHVLRARAPADAGRPVRSAARRSRFTYGLGGELVFPLRAGAATPAARAADPGRARRAVAEHGVTVLFTAPTAYRAMLAAGKATALPACAAACRPASRCRGGLGRLPRARPGCGSSTASAPPRCCTSSSPPPTTTSAPGSTGRPVPGYEAAVLDDAGRPVPDGEPGRLAVRGPTGCRYLADPRQQAYVQHGWNLTGDTYRRDADGYFWYVARSDDMIISAGYNIAGPEVENALLTLPDVVECGVVAKPGPGPRPRRRRVRGAARRAWPATRPRRPSCRSW